MNLQPNILTMPQSHSNVLTHIVFSTKNREQLIDPVVQDRLHAYLATLARATKSECYRIGAMPDHVHLAIRMARTISQSDLLKDIKKESSKWIKTLGAKYQKFSWQRGFGCYSVSPTQREKLLGYISGQEVHHKTITFQDEYRELMRRNGIEWDERYVWD